MKKINIPPMPEGFHDQAAWDAIHWEFNGDGRLLDSAVTSWQLENQDRCKAALEALLMYNKVKFTYRDFGEEK
jgi:hypothetical protein